MIVTNLLTLQNQLKIHHWQTKSFAEHEALGKTYETFDGLIDEFIEVLMGKYGRVQSKGGFTLELKNYNELSTLEFVDKYIEYLSDEVPKNLDEKDTDLLNLRDEMIAALNKLKYLLTLS